MLIHRRTLLAGSSVLLVAACSSEPEGAQTTSETPVPGNQEQSQRVERSLLALYAAVGSTYPELTPELTPLRDQHAAHLAALGGEPGDDAAPQIAATAAGAIEQCIQAEIQAANAHQASCLPSDATDARLLTLISASEASHVPVLRNLL